MGSLRVPTCGVGRNESEQKHSKRLRDVPTVPTVPTTFTGVRDRLSDLARRVRRLGCCGRTDPESVLVEKHELADQLMRLAREIGR